jgi:prepilin-type N-terminal cleavage/methylation domain-containing protein
MFTWRCRRGLTLVEMLVVLAVITVMAGILVPVVYHARRAAKLSACTSNLAQIAVATKMYYDDHGGPPVTDLPVALADYVDSTDVFVCPEDVSTSHDSYSEFFVARRDATDEQFLVGCPRHAGDTRTAVAFARGSCEADRLLDVTWNGEPIGPGDTVTGGEMVFSDGSRVTIADGMTVGMLVSFTTHGRPYSIIWVPQGSQGCVDCSVTPGSLFEVVTPSAIAGVQGTRFVVYVSELATETNTLTAEVRSVTRVGVYKGAVLLVDRSTKKEHRLTPGNSKLCSKRKERTAKGPRWGRAGTRFGRTIAWSSIQEIR